jgi:hypothetical protein
MARICVEVIPFVAGYCATAPSAAATSSSVRAWAFTRNWLRAWYLPASTSRVPGG